MTGAPTRSAKPTVSSGFGAATWAALAHGEAAAPLFDQVTLDGLPAPAQRFLRRALPDGVPLSPLVFLGMDGEIKLGGRWLGFTADQIVRGGVGFVWAPVVGGRLIRFVGADALGPDGARTEFRFHGRIPVVRAGGDDVRRSASGRLAAETVAWLPQLLTPQAGARWAGVDVERAIVTIDAAGTDVEVEVTVGADGRLRRLGLQRWNDVGKTPGYAPFGGSVDSILTTPSGVRIAGSGTVGWEWGTPEEANGVFFRYRITSAHVGEFAADDAGSP